MEIAIAVAAVALTGAVVFAYATRRKMHGPPELVAAAKAVMSGKCECGGRLVKDLADGGDMAVFNCTNPECGRRFMVDLSEEDEEPPEGGQDK